MAQNGITLGLIAADRDMLPGLFRKHMPQDWQLVTSGIALDDGYRSLLGAVDYLVMAGGELPREELSAAGKLRMVQKMGVGFDTIDTKALSERGIPLANCPLDSAALSVAEMAMTLAVSSLKSIVWLDDSVHRRHAWPKWESRARIRQIAFQTVGVVGFGHIGSNAARLFLGLGCKVIVYSRRKPDNAEQFAQECNAAGRLSFTSDLDSVFRDASVVSVHVSLNKETHHLIGRRQLDLLGPEGLFVNTARGDVVDEAELVAALKEGRLGGAALDVLSIEPPPADLPILSAPNVVITPHCAGGGSDVTAEKAFFALQNVLNFHEGREIESRIV